MSYTMYNHCNDVKSVKHKHTLQKATWFHSGPKNPMITHFVTKDHSNAYNIILNLQWFYSSEAIYA